MSRRSSPQQQSPIPRQRTRRGLPWGKLFLLFLLALLALAWFAPTLIVKSSFRDRILQTALKDFTGKVQIGSASAGWLSPIEVNKAVVFDPQGEEVMNVGAIRTEKNLFSLVLDHQQIGKIRLEQPRIKLKLRADGSNVEDMIKPLLAGDKSSAPIALSVEVVDGTVDVTYVGSDVTWRLEKLEGGATIPQSPSSPFTARMKSAITGATNAPGSLSADLQWQPAPKNATAEKAGFGQGTVTIQSNGLPLELITLATRRAGLDVQLSGLMTTDLSLVVANKMTTAKIQQFATQNLFVASPSLLGPDQLQLATASGSGEISRSNTDWQFRAVNLQTDVGKLTATGSGPVTGSDSLASELVRAFRSGNWEVHSNLDVANLAAMLPNTFRLREGTHVSSGQLAIDLTSQVNPNGNVWNADIEATQLAALHAGTSFEWKKPISVKAAVRESAGNITVDQLTCDSTFLQLRGAGTLAQGNLVVNGDLSQFVNEVGRFVDLGTLKAAGKFQGQVEWQNAGADLLALTGNGSATDFELTYAADKPWQEQQLVVQFNSTGKLSGGRVTQINRGQLQITAAGDRLEAELLETIPEVSSSTTWPCHVRVRGDLGRWLARIQMFAPLEGWQIDGDDIDIEGKLAASAKRWEFVTIRQPGQAAGTTATPAAAAAPGANNYSTIKNFQFLGSGLSILEPNLQIESTASYDLSRGEFTSPATTIASSSIALRAEKTRMIYRDGQVALDGDVKYRANLERLSSWLRDSRQPATYRLQGEAIGAIQLEYANGTSKANLTAGIDQFAYATPAKRAAGLTIAPVNQPPSWQELWKEPRLELALIGSLDGNGQQAIIEKLEIAGDSLSIGAAGSVRQPFARCELDLSGQYAYDLERLSQRFRGMLGPQIQMTGTGQRPFSIRGPFMAIPPAQSTIRNASSATAPAQNFGGLQQILAEISVGWQSLVVQGFEVGAGEVATKLERGLLTITPIDVPVSEGKVSFVPTIDVTRTPYTATLQPGTIVDRVRISPQMCHTWLKYLAPLAAHATTAEGHFSVSVKEANFPVTDPTGGNVEGKLIIHTAQIGPGPLSQELLSAVQLIRNVLDKRPLAALDQQNSARWLDMPEQQLDLQLTDHKVYHRDMKFAVDDVEVRTSGWVGLDQQLSLVAIVPVRDEWVSKDPYLASLKGQTIQLPINGTLTRPLLDRTALTQFSRQAAIGAGQNLLQQQLDRGLNRLFQPKGTPNAPPQQPQ